MGKIVSDSLMPSKANAPLDSRTEIDTLADYKKIENPHESLIFFCRDTKKRYEVASLVEETIEGTNIKRKVIGSYKQFGGLSDAQKQDLENTKNKVVTLEQKDKAIEAEIGNINTTLNEAVIFEEVGDADLDDVFDQEDVETSDVEDAPRVDFDNLQ